MGPLKSVELEYINIICAYGLFHCGEPVRSYCSSVLEYLSVLLVSLLLKFFKIRLFYPSCLAF
jgi:hypothetical protein